MKHALSWFVGLLLLSAAAPGLAEVKAGSFSVTPFVGGYTFDGVQHLETSPIYGLRGGYNFTRNFGVEAVFGFATTDHTNGAGDVDLYNYYLDAIYHFLPENRLVPFVAAGYGGVYLHNDNLIKDVSQGAFNYGAGVKYFFTDALALRADVRHLIMTKDETLNNLEYTIGLSFVFGGEKPAPPPVAPPPPPAPVEEEAPPAPPAAAPTPGHYKYCVTLHMEYDICSAVIRPEYHDEIAKVGDFMKKYPDTTAVIEGHTDNIPVTARCQYKDNMALSQARAEKVVDYLVENFGIDRSRLAAKGYGPNNPVADNTTDEGKQKNHRIEAIIDCTFVPQEIKTPERLCMQLQVEFDTGKADIKPQYKNEIAKVADYMKQYPETTALIEGHTDNVGGYDFNMKLSQKRAENVVNYLVENFGIDRSRLSAKGYGYTRRIAYNTTPEGRQKNRRIDAVIDCVIKN
jgi:OOP family OmpA-OmpF porin